MDDKKGKKLEPPASNIVSNLLAYDDYRKFLADFFKEQKERKKFFSHRYFAQRAGFRSSGSLHKVIKGITNLSHKSVQMLCRALHLDTFSSEYFTNLVFYNQAKSNREKTNYADSLENQRKRVQHYHLEQKHFAYFDNWYYPVIRELASYANWEPDYKKLGTLVYPPISAEQAQTAVETLVEIGLLYWNDDGKIQQSSSVITTADIPGTVRETQRKEILQKGMDAAMFLPKDQRHVSYTTLAITEQTYHKIEEIINEARMKILDCAVKDEGAERIYQLVFEVFPFSRKFGGGKK
jgi:uncharacterized protein (TIGR02147 family)